MNNETTNTTDEQKKRADAIADIEAMLEWVKEHPECPAPRVSGYWWCYDKKDEFVAIAGAMGTYEKTLEDRERSIRLTKSFGSVKLIVSGDRESVSRKVTVSKPVEEWVDDFGGAE